MRLEAFAKRLGVRRRPALFIAALFCAQISQARLQIVQPATEPFVFSGKARQIEVVFHNVGTDDLAAPLSTRVFQASSSTLAPIGPHQDWKKLRVLAGQKVIETATFDFPDVRAMTVFQIRWLNGDNEIGQSTVHVLPTNVLSQISVLTTNKPVGLIDPDDVLKPLLKNCAVKYEELSAKKPFAEFKGRLVLIAASADADIVDAGLTAGSKHPIIVLWMRELGPHIGSVPNLYFVQAGQVQVAVVDANLFADLEHSALAQINLLRCIKTAQHPEKLKLPTSSKVRPE